MIDLDTWSPQYPPPVKQKPSPYYPPTSSRETSSYENDRRRSITLSGSRESPICLDTKDVPLMDTKKGLMVELEI